MSFFRQITQRDKLVYLTFFSYTWSAQRKYLMSELERHCDKISQLSGYHKALKVFNKMKSRFKILEMSKLYKFYLIFSTTIHVIYIVQNVAIYFIGEGVKSNSLNKYLYCYGAKLLIHPRVDPKMLMLSWSFFHLVWRFLMFIYVTNYNFPSIFFALEDEIAMRRLIERVEKDQNLDYELEADPLFSVMFFEQKVNQKKAGYRLRLNRNLDVKRRLLNKAESLFNYSMMIFSALFIILLPMGFMTIYSGRMYAGCNTTVLSFLIRYTNSTIVSMVLGADSFGALFLPACFSIVMVDDLKYYWRNIRRNMEDLVAELQRHNSISNNLQEYATMQPYDYSKQLRKSSLYLDSYSRNQRNSVNSLLILEKDRGLEVKLLQSQTLDFFKQLKLVNRFISLLVTFVIAIWFSNTTLVTFVRLGADLLLIKIVQVFGLLALNQLVPIIVLGQEVRSAYGLICSIMCLEQDRRIKENWRAILKFYTEKPARYGFTLLTKEVLSTNTIIKYAGTTLTASLLIVNYLHDQNDLRSAFSL